MAKGLTGSVAPGFLPIYIQGLCRLMPKQKAKYTKKKPSYKSGLTRARQQPIEVVHTIEESEVQSVPQPPYSLALVGQLLGWLAARHAQFKATIKRKKEERLTLMFIPHNERSIRNYHISNLTLTIILSIVSFLLVVSSFLVIMHNSTVQEVDKMKVSQKDAQLQFAKIREEIKSIGETFAEVRDMISSLYGYAKGKDEAVAVFAAGGVDLKAMTTQFDAESADKKDADAIPLEVFLLERIADDMHISQEKLSDVQDFLKKREKIIRNTPTLWPVRGYIINPYGFVRGADRLNAAYNRGVDIASHPGAVVNATAPGIVVSVQKDSRFMYTVRIRHNYGYETVYQGLERVTVATDEKISKGESIGYIGHSNDILEAILHYEIHIGVEPVDPMPYLSHTGS